jgi:hypothetical protein
MTTQETRIKVSLATGERYLVSNVGTDCRVWGPLDWEDVADICAAATASQLTLICGVTPAKSDDFSDEAGWETEVRFADMPACNH